MGLLGVEKHLNHMEIEIRPKSRGVGEEIQNVLRTVMVGAIMAAISESIRAGR